MKTYRFEFFVTIPEKAAGTLFRAILRIVEAIGGTAVGTFQEWAEGLFREKKDHGA